MDAVYAAAVSTAETFALRHWTSLSTTSLIQNFIFCFVLQFLAFKILKIVIYPKYFSPLRNIPGPKDDFPLLGQVVNQIKQSGPNELWLKWIQQWPEEPFIRYLSFGNSETLLVTSLKGYREVLQTKCYSFVKPDFFRRIISEIIGVGLLFTEGEAHRRERRLLNGPFSHANLKALAPVFNEKALALVSAVREKLIDRDGAIIDVAPLHAEAALDVIGQTTIGVELDHLGGRTDFDFRECYYRILEQPPIGNVISAINSFVPVRSWLPLEANRRFINANRRLKDHLRGVIRTRRKEIAAGKDLNQKDLLTLILRERDPASPKGAENPWSDEDILGYILGFMAAGHETTAGTLTWSVYALCMYPEIQSKLRAEITATFPLDSDSDAERVPTWDRIESLKYLNDFVREVLRRYSPTISTPRVATSDMTIDGVHIPKGTTLMIAFTVANLHPRIWGDDALEFRPGRWEELAKNDRDPAADPMAFQTFSNGPRICIGKNFALFEIKVMLVRLLGAFEFQWPEDAPKEVELVNTFVLKPKGGMKVRVKAL